MDLSRYFSKLHPGLAINFVLHCGFKIVYAAATWSEVELTRISQHQTRSAHYLLFGVHHRASLAWVILYLLEHFFWSMCSCKSPEHPAPSFQMQMCMVMWRARLLQNGLQYLLVVCRHNWLRCKPSQGLQSHCSFSTSTTCCPHLYRSCTAATQPRQSGTE